MSGRVESEAVEDAANEAEVEEEEGGETQKEEEDGGETDHDDGFKEKRKELRVWLRMRGMVMEGWRLRSRHHGWPNLILGKMVMEV